MQDLRVLKNWMCVQVHDHKSRQVSWRVEHPLSVYEAVKHVQEELLKRQLFSSSLHLWSDQEVH